METVVEKIHVRTKLRICAFFKKQNDLTPIFDLEISQWMLLDRVFASQKDYKVRVVTK